MRLYIAGPMTGLPENNYPAFHEAAKRLRAAGYEVESPAENTRPITDSWADFMRDGITQMLTCDGVALLDGWAKSRGAWTETYVANRLEMTVALFHYWLEQAEESDAA